MKKLNHNRGETLIEVLASILVASLSVALLFGCVMTASKIDQRAAESDIKHYEAYGNAETHTAAEDEPPPTAQVEFAGAPIPIPIKIYGGEGMFSYERDWGSNEEKAGG